MIEELKELIEALFLEGDLHPGMDE
jgi:hypothetical protein